jgi:hypothetical protein
MSNKGACRAWFPLLIGLSIVMLAQLPAFGSVQDSMDAVARNHPVIGNPIKPFAAIPGGYQREYEWAIVYYDNASPGTTSEVHGEILAKYLLSGGPASSLGFPRTSEMTGAHGVGQYNHFANGSIYWFPLLGAYTVSGAIKDKWVELGAEGGPLGYPTADAQNLGNRGVLGRFQYGIIHYLPVRGAHYMYGPLLQKWADSNGERGSYGYPIEDPYTLNGKWYQRFETGTLAVDDRSRDLRSEITRRGIGIRNQGGRGTCSIFAMTFLLEYAYTEMLGSGYADLSEEYLNHAANVAMGTRDDGDYFSSAAAGYQNFGMIQEGAMVYNPNRVYDFNAVTITPQMYAEGQTLLQNGFRMEGHFVVPLGEAGATQEQFDAILSYVARGIPVAVGRGHSMAMVGFKYDQTQEGGGYVIFKNSYGPTSDENGYKRESFASVKSTVNDAYVFEQPYKVDWTPPGEIAAYWKLDETSGTTAADSSGYERTGALKGGPTWTTGMRARALTLDGKDDFVDCGDGQDLPSGRAARSICAWAKTDTIAGGWRWIVAYGTGGQGQAMFLGQNGNSLYGGGYSDDLQLAGFWSPGVWQHVCLTYDGTTARLYANGQQVNSGLKTWNLVLNRVHIGRQVNDAAEFWDGSIDDVRIYRRALPQTDVKAIMDGKPVPDDAGITVSATE